MGFVEKLRDVAGKMKLGPHHKIERFSITIAVIAALCVVLIGTTAYASWQSGKEDLSTKVIYNSTFTSSLTETTGEVIDVYQNEENTRSMIMLKYDNPDVPGFSSNAENYEAHIIATTPDLQSEVINTQLDGQIVMFGSTGYMGVVIESDQPLTEQILGLTIRNNSQAALGDYDVEANEQQSLGDATFAEYDQFRVFYNPGASDTTHLPALDGRGLNVKQVYADTVLDGREHQVRADLGSQLRTLQDDLALVSELEGQMNETTADGVRIVPPEVPEEIAGDQIVGERGETVPKEVMIDNAWEVVATSPDSTLALETDWVHPSGFDLDWRDGSISEGYLDELLPVGENYYTFLSNKADSIATGASDDEPTPADFSVREMEWLLDTGKDLGEVSQDQSGLEHLVKIRNDLSNAYETYYEDKVTYQVDLFNDLLELEVELAAVESSHSIHDGDKAIQTY